MLLMILCILAAIVGATFGYLVAIATTPRLLASMTDDELAAIAEAVADRRTTTR